ncbi:tail fiber assembly protein [Serratia marcescens]|uniref:tail fiber assembly protein n=1 Tax=Serratia marcescens TaxID=615 RepID=UPI000C9BC476|nr:tail fiber assembly protein [Serratia marcescens]MDP8772792.1 tail fiber assembly protein [Serratia marcescens]MDP8803197.1 tail fiber assembly protein [Serratia marcescens]HAT3729226.1 tail fiber assembly protein [Serratia marcescens]
MMISYGYSASTTSFYVLEEREGYEKYNNWPDDVKPVAASVWEKYCGQWPTGKMRGADENGDPCWVDIPPPTKAEQRETAERQKAQRLEKASKAIAPLQDADDLGMATEEEAAQLKLWKTYRVQLNRINPQDAPEIDWPVAPGA